MSLRRALVIALPLFAAPLAAQSDGVDPGMLSNLYLARSTEAEQTGFGLRVEPIRFGGARPVFLGLEATSFYKTIDAATESSAGSVTFGLGLSTMFGRGALRPHIGAGLYNVWAYASGPGVDVSETAWWKVKELRGGVTWFTGVRWAGGRRGLMLQAEAAQQWAEGGDDLLLKVGIGAVRLR
ncbi:MAG TPA: hypothetical protein VG940_06725 [Gemmatimonadales bacterium]|nr:hypothetical protein [Gemmatimonadales bacterium]